LTTNGYDFVRHSQDLRDAGLDRVTFSLDSLRPSRFAEITGVDAFERVIQSIDTAKTMGFEPVKINAVVVRDRNDDELVEFARFAREHDVAMRYRVYASRFRPRMEP